MSPRTPVWALAASEPVYPRNCRHPIPHIAAPRFMRQRDIDWLIEAAWAEHHWPPNTRRTLARNTRVLHELSSLRES